MGSSRRSSTALVPTTKPSVSSRNLQGHNRRKEVPHADPPRCRPWMFLDEANARKSSWDKRSAGPAEPSDALVLGFLSFYDACPRVLAIHAALAFREFEQHAGISIYDADCWCSF